METTPLNKYLNLIGSHFSNVPKFRKWFDMIITNLENKELPKDLIDKGERSLFLFSISKEVLENKNLKPYFLEILKFYYPKIEDEKLEKALNLFLEASKREKRSWSNIYEEVIDHAATEIIKVLNKEKIDLSKLLGEGGFKDGMDKVNKELLLLIKNTYEIISTTNNMKDLCLDIMESIFKINPEFIKKHIKLKSIKNLSELKEKFTEYLKYVCELNHLHKESHVNDKNPESVHYLTDIKNIKGNEVIGTNIGRLTLEESDGWGILYDPNPFTANSVIPNLIKDNIYKDAAEIFIKGLSEPTYYGPDVFSKKSPTVDKKLLEKVFEETGLNKKKETDLTLKPFFFGCGLIRIKINEKYLRFITINYNTIAGNSLHTIKNGTGDQHHVEQYCTDTLILLLEHLHSIGFEIQEIEFYVTGYSPNGKTQDEPCTACLKYYNSKIKDFISEQKKIKIDNKDLKGKVKNKSSKKEALEHILPFIF